MKLLSKKPEPFSPSRERCPEIVRAFDSLYSMGFRVVQPEPVQNQEIKPPSPLRSSHDLNIAIAEHELLRDMAKTAVWQEVGGMAAGWQGQIRPRGFKSQSEMNEQGIGRTHWVGMPEWARGLGMNKAAIKHAVEKAIAGESLGKRQTRCLRLMRAEIRGHDLSAIPEETVCPF